MKCFALSFMGLLFLTACQDRKVKQDVLVMSDGLEIPVTACEQVYGKLYGASMDAKQFCACFLPAFYERIKNDPEKVRIFKEQKAEYMLQVGQDSLAKDYQQCVAHAATKDTTARFTMTPRMVASMKKGMMIAMKRQNMDTAMDIDKYCDCMIESLQTDFTAAEIMKENFNETEKFGNAQNICMEKAKIGFGNVPAMPADPADEAPAGLLTAERIGSMPDDELLEQVIFNIINRLPKNAAEEYKSILKLSAPERAIYIVSMLKAEVNNGGFNQYYYNPTGQYASLAPDALKLIGAVRIAGLVNAANKTYKQHKAQITKEQDGTPDGFGKSYENNPLSKLDDVFYDMDKKEPLDKMMAAFIRKNNAVFVHLW